MTETEKEQRIRQAKDRRYKKPILSHLNLESIRNDLYDMSDATGDVRYFCETEDDSFLESLIGDEEEAFELKTMISQLNDDVEQMLTDLEEEWVPEYFDLFFVRVAGAKSRVASQFGGLAGFDDYQGDYYGLSTAWEMEWAVEEAEKKLQKLTKKEMAQAATQCFLIAANYIALKNRYDALNDSLEIVRGRNTGILATVKEIDRAYEAAEKACFSMFDEATTSFERAVQGLPDEAWVQ